MPKKTKAAPEHTGTNTDMKIWKFIRENAVRDEQLDKTAIIDNDRSFTFRQFFRRWETYAEVFAGLGITEEKHSRIGLIMAPSFTSLSVIYGANMVGVSISAITETESFNMERLTELFRKEEITDLIIDNTFIRQDALKEIMKHKDECGLRNVILVHQKYEPSKVCEPVMGRMMEMNYRQLKTVPGVLDMNELRIKYEATPFKKSETMDDAAYIVHTSGTTKGIHKPIPLSDRAVNESAVRILDDPYFDSLKGGTGMISGFLSGAFFFLDQMNLFLSAGCTIVIVPFGYLNPNGTKAISEYKITVLITAPMYFDKVLFSNQKSVKADFSSVEYIVLGGSFASGNKRRDINKFIAEKGGHAKVAVGYGLSEVGGAAILSAPGVEDDSIGYPMRGVKVRIQDETDDKFYDITDGQRSGGLYICSTSNSSGKIGDTQFFETETIDGEEYICTYDRVTVNEDGSLTCHGRMNRYFVNNEGIKFDAGLIEVSMEKEAGIDECAIVPHFDKKLHDTVPVLYIAVKETGIAARNTVRNALYHIFVKDSKAEQTNVPGKVVICRELPHNQAGKADIYQIINDGLEGDSYAIMAIRRDGVLKDIKLLPEKAAGGNPDTLPVEMQDEYKKYIIPMFKEIEMLTGHSKGGKKPMPKFKNMFPMMGCNPMRANYNEDDDVSPRYNPAKLPFEKPMMGCNPNAMDEDDEEDNYDDDASPRYNPAKLPFGKPMMGCNPNAMDEDDEDDYDDDASPRYNPAKLPLGKPMMGCNPYGADEDDDEDEDED